MADENLLQNGALILFPALFWFSISLQTQGSLIFSQSCSRLLITWSLLPTFNSLLGNFQSQAVTVFEKSFNNFKGFQKYIILLQQNPKLWLLLRHPIAPTLPHMKSCSGNPQEHSCAFVPHGWFQVKFPGLPQAYTPLLSFWSVTFIPAHFKLFLEMDLC